MLCQTIWTLSLHVGAVLCKPDMLLARLFVHVCLPRMLECQSLQMAAAL